MKKPIFMTLAVFMLALFSGFTFAQGSPIDEGSMMAAGGFSFSNWSGDLYEDADNNSQTVIDIFPILSYFILPGLAAGGEFAYSRISQSDWSYTAFGIGPQVRYYFVLNREQTEAKGSTYPYFSVNFLFGTAKFKSDSGESKYTYKTFGFGLGAVYMISDAVGVFGQGGFDIDSRKPEDGDSVSGNVLGFDVGFTYFIY